MLLTLVTFTMMALVVVMTPGPTVLLALSNGSHYGLGRAMPGVIGAALSDVVLITAAALGLGALLAASAFWFTVVKTIGVAYLIWIGVQMLRAGGAGGRLPAQSGAGDAGTLMRKSFLVAATNPKGYLFFTAFLPQFITLSAPVVPQYLMLGLVFVAVDVAVMTVYAALGAKAVRLLRHKGAIWIDRTCGGFLVALGVALAFVRRGTP